MSFLSGKRFEVTVLGSGTSTGVPVVGCPCFVCKSPSSYNKRFRSSVYIVDKKRGKSLLIDTTPDLRLQLLANEISSCDYLLFTHTHADHCHGLDDLRPLFFREKKEIKVWAHPIHEKELKERFYYMFQETGYEGLKPSLDFITFEELQSEFSDIHLETALLPHGSAKSSIFKIDSFLYATDFKTFPRDLIEKWRGKLDLVIASAPTFKPHSTHSCMPETISLIQDLEARRGYLTHLSHMIDHIPHSDKLPEGISFAFDGMKLSF